jgi:hypothetical protein
MISIPVYLVPQPADSGLHHIGLGIEMVVPNVFHDHRLGNDSTRAAHQVFEQRKLPGLQIDAFTPPRDLPGEEIDGQVPDAEPDRIRNAARPADQRLYAGQKFREGKGFRKIVVSPGLQPLHPVVHRTLRAQNQDGGVHLFGAHLFDQCQAASPGQHEIDDGRIVRFRQGEAETLLAVRGVVHGIPRRSQPLDDERGDLDVIFYQQNSHRHPHGDFRQYRLVVFTTFMDRETIRRLLFSLKNLVARPDIDINRMSSSQRWDS